MTTTRCVACDSGELSYLYRWNDGFAVCRCAACGLLCTDPLPDTAQLVRYYRNLGRSEGDQHGHMRVRADAAEVLPVVRAAVARYFEIIHEIRGRTPTRTFLDVGGGMGWYSKAAESLGYEAVYVDLDDEAVEFARTALALERVIQADVQHLADEIRETFDVVFARHTIEHLRDPGLFLAQLARLVKPGGIVVIETPNAANWEQWAHPRIFAFYSAILRRENVDVSSTRRLAIAVAKPLSAATPPKHLYGFNESNLTTLLERHGFENRKRIVTVCGDPVFDPLYYRSDDGAHGDLLRTAYRVYERSASSVIRRLGKGSLLIVFAERADDGAA